MRACASIDIKLKALPLTIIYTRSMTKLKTEELQAQANQTSCIIDASVHAQDQQLSNLCAESRANSATLDTQTSMLSRLTRTVSLSWQELQTLVQRVL